MPSNTFQRSRALVSLGIALFLVGCGDPSSKTPVAVNHASSTIVAVSEIVADQLGIDRSKISPTTTLGELGADELDFVELIMEFEDHFAITIPDESAERMLGTDNWQEGMKRVTIAKLASVIDERRQNSQIGPILTSPENETPEKRNVVKITPAAAAKIGEAQQQEDKPFLRVSVVSEGPTEFMYDLRFEEGFDIANDYVDEVDGIKIVVDKRSAIFLEGATIDWQITAEGHQGFHFENPNAVE